MNRETIHGTIVKWNDEKGFGFIESEYGKSMFFHISEYRPPNTPIIGDKIVFILGKDKQGRLQAKHVQSAEFVKKKKVEHQKRQNAQKQYQKNQQAFESGQRFKLVVVATFFVLLTILVLLNWMPWIVLVWYGVINIVTFGLYAKDKSAAQQGGWRTPENTLHTFAIIGGWLGAMMAQTYLRHKSKKTEFRVVYYLTVLINLSILIYYMYIQNFQS